MFLCRVCLRSDTESKILSSTYYLKFFVKILGLELESSPDTSKVCIYCDRLIQRSLTLCDVALRSNDVWKQMNVYKQDGGCNKELETAIAACKETTGKLHKLSKHINDNINLVDSGDTAIDDDDDDERAKEESNDAADDSSACKEEAFKEAIDVNVNVKNETKYINDFKFKESLFKVVYLGHDEQVEEVEERKKSGRSFRRKFQCELCGVAFLTENVLKTHMHKHFDVTKPYKCDICSLRFASQEVLSQHLLAHRRYFVCDLCGIKLRRPWHCVVHSSKCGSAQSNIMCSYCQKVFRNGYVLKSHVKSVHLKEKRFICDLCKKGFTFKRKLTDHLRTHNKEKPFTCDICQHSFSSNSNLTSHHRVVHEQTSKTYYCVECDLYYKTGKSLRRHFAESPRHKTSSDVEYHQCTECLKSFQSDKNVKSHVNIKHLKSTPYKCSHCDKIFSSNANLRKHQRNLHNEHTCHL